MRCKMLAAIACILTMPPLVAAQKVPRKLRDVTPVYPHASLERGDEGAVVVELRIAPNGAVEAARLLKSSCPRLNDAALVAARQWRFEPVTLGGRATTYSMTAIVPFRPGARKPPRPAPDACVWTDTRPLT
jgi:TonB family protein